MYMYISCVLIFTRVSSECILLQCAVQLLEFKADLHKQNKNGANALYFACRLVYTPSSD